MIGICYIVAIKFVKLLDSLSRQTHIIPIFLFSINCLFNDQNYWLNIKQRGLVRTGKKNPYLPLHLFGIKMQIGIATNGNFLCQQDFQQRSNSLIINIRPSEVFL